MKFGGGSTDKQIQGEGERERCSYKTTYSIISI